MDIDGRGKSSQIDIVQFLSYYIE